MDNAKLPGVLLVILGVVLLVATQAGVGGEIVVFTIGACFLVAWAITREYGLLVPGGILSGLGAGILLEQQVEEGGLVVLGLGLGFLLIALLTSSRMPAWWWPLVPGGVLTIVGLAGLREAEGLLGDIARWWPGVLVLLGVWLIVRARPGKTPDGHRPDQQADQQAGPPRQVS